MNKFIISSLLCAMVVLGGAQAVSAQTDSSATVSNTEAVAKIKELMKLIAELQAKLEVARGEVKNIVADLKIGSQGADVKEIQELLASDSSIFGAKPTGYYGPLTEAAIKKFQERYGLPVTGVVDEATRAVMQELKMERKNGMIPPGLVKSDEVKERIKLRLKEKWKDCDFEKKFRASVCEKVKDKRSSDDDSDDDNSASSTDATRAEALAAITDAQKAIDSLKASLAKMIADDVDEDDIDDARDAVRKAQKKLIEARKKLSRGDFDGAIDKAEDAIEEAGGEDDSDDDDDDEDEDDDDDEDEDEDDDDDDDDDDDEEDDD